MPSMPLLKVVHIAFLLLFAVWCCCINPYLMQQFDWCHAEPSVRSILCVIGATWRCLSNGSTVLPLPRNLVTPSCIGRTSRQPNYPNQLAPKRGSQTRLGFDPNLTWWAYQAISLLFRPGTLSAGGLISPLFSPSFDGNFDQLQLIRATLIFKMQKVWSNK